jgi:HlyD family secretion protein
MDRPVDSAILRRRWLRRAAIGLVLATSVVLALVLLPAWIRPSVDRERIRTAFVERGPVEATLTATGVVLPEYEHVLTSPAATRVETIFHFPGDEVAPDDVILQLDASESRLAVDRLDQRIALQRNQRKTTQLELDAKLSDLKGQEEIKELERQSFEYELQRNKRLAELGLVTDDVARKSATDLERAKIELRELGRQEKNAGRIARAQLEALDLEIELLVKERDEAQSLADRAQVRSDRRGVLTWVTPSEGASLARGDVVARVADLSSFKVEATLSDVHASRVRVGQPATIRSGDIRLSGTVSKILPTVENGVLTFEITLAQSDHPGLRHNLRVDVYLVVDRKSDTLRVKRGSFFHVDGQPHVFVVRGDVAVRTPVTFGISSFEQYEIEDGVSEGDEVIVSDMSDYRNAQEVRLR